MNKAILHSFLLYKQSQDSLNEFTRSKLSNDEGEIGSWLILAAGLAIAAGLAVTALGPWIGAKVTDITTAGGG